MVREVYAAFREVWLVSAGASGVGCERGLPGGRKKCDFAPHLSPTVSEHRRSMLAFRYRRV